MSRLRSPALRAASALLAALVLASCASLPSSGPVVVEDAPAASASPAPFDFNPPGPREDATPEQIASGFLSALQATPVTTSAAMQFLTAEAAETWRPGRRTLVYGSQRLVTGVGAVSVLLDDAYELDRAGRWRGAAGEGGSVTLRLTMAREDGQWRIADAPDVLVVPQSHVEARYRQFSLYFLDPTMQVLVPEPVYLPAGVQAPTLLVSGVLDGPRDARAERTALPAELRLGVGVPVDGDGVAQVPLSEEILEVGEDEFEPLLAQLAWTLRQLPEIERLGITVEGTAVELPGGFTSVDVDSFPEYSPVVSGATSDLFGIRGDEIRQVVGTTEITAAVLAEGGPPTAIGAVGVSLNGRRLAVLDEDRANAYLLDRDAQDGPVPTPVYAGGELLAPMWDLVGALWLVDRSRGRALVQVGDRSRVLPLPRGFDPIAAALSRDGTRMAWVTPQRDSQQLAVSRVVRRLDGTPVRFARPRAVATGETWNGVRDLAWRDPVTVAALTRPTPGSSQVLLARIDGSSDLEALASSPSLLFAPGVAMAASPADPPVLVVASREGRVHRLRPDGRWELDAVEAGLQLPTFVG